MRAFTLLLVAVLAGLAVWGTLRDPNFWLAADARGDRLARAGNYEAAAAAYVDPGRRGTALYRAGKFPEAAAAFAVVATPEAAYDRGNCFVLLGKYDDAIQSYDRALALRPNWPECVDNRAVAVVRRDRLKTQGGDETGGQVKADEIVFDKNKHSSSKQTTEVAGGDPLDGEQLRGLWLRRVQTKPADFLRAKFAFQVQAAAEEPKP